LLRLGTGTPTGSLSFTTWRPLEDRIPVAETTGLRKPRTDFFLSIGLMLHDVGITPNRDAARFVLANDDGKQFSVDFKALAPDEKPQWGLVFCTVDFSGWPVSQSLKPEVT
jgi:hypothetical protein